ncbi:membrane protein [Cryobacterium roopkundense]|uniref:Membrane protein n=1 Tax=Cryobacterium roopkundense TaxID=1001240 RepID=A0A099JVN6_9MICO|nr:DUF2273 domain-containing protein [Cryobacterium roopkundense]KGJ81737.1 membrane protein [Cryobacterium roopkundense]MBB5642468.1 putative membrane protein [Cryobacterium roopkundense]
MSHTTIGIAVGAILALTAVMLGFWAFLLVAVAMGVGAVVARVLDGDLDLRRVADAFRGRRSSS